MNFRDADYLREWDAQVLVMRSLSRRTSRIRLEILWDLAVDGQVHAPAFAAAVDTTLEAFGC